MRLTNQLFIILISFMLLSCLSPQKAQIDTSTVKNYELSRYLGKWYEIARFPHRFEKDLVGVTATYKLLDNGKIEVINAGYKDSFDGKFKTARAKAKIPNKKKPGRIKVYFVPFFGADYNIMELDTINYEWAMVGSSSPNFLWILSRNKVMDEKTFNHLKQKAIERGYNLKNLEKVPQKKPPIDLFFSY